MRHSLWSLRCAHLRQKVFHSLQDALPTATEAGKLLLSRGVTTESGEQDIRQGKTNGGPLVSDQHFYESRVLDKYLTTSVSPITLRQLIFVGRNLNEERLIKSANYVRSEIATRLAHRIRDLQTLPFIVGANSHFQQVYDLYWSAFQLTHKFPRIKSVCDNDGFCRLLQTMLGEHLVVIPQLALGISECIDFLPPAHIERFMNVMLRSRISRRVLAEQHLALSNDFRHIRPDSQNAFPLDRGRQSIGTVFERLKAADVVHKCSRLVTQLTRDNYGEDGLYALRDLKKEMPTIRLEGHLDTSFTYIPEHIEFIIYELLKNAVRATMSKHQCSKTTRASPPDIVTTICSSPEDVIFRISDQGGGINTATLESLWKFANPNKPFDRFTTVTKLAGRLGEEDRECAPSHDPYGTSGLGLPLSKVYAEYWGGNLKLYSMDGYGTDAYVRIPKLGNVAENVVGREMIVNDQSTVSLF
ncbi:hypothetical protein BZG36_04796 [Bifiguratus adelaidae]|uniref:Protein-serine/threonine kinase n=1 Tax=Bifiguratus adelaidae TaxID=1938954 RepID=A0A261XUU1_9FUNG|nr:hypothetical protein BZG36_04796 [Bifiguratus adelaidae]